MRLRDRTGALVYDDELPLSAASAKSDSVKLALPTGQWKVQLLLPHMGRRLRSPVRRVIVKSADCQVIPLTGFSRPEPCKN